jgi:CheY-like chemotaxis protein
MMDQHDGQLNILLIDDDESMRRLVLDILAADGHQVISCTSAEEGLEQLPFFTFQVAFLDHNLPGMEGLVLGEYLRRNNPHMAIALVTGETDKRLERVSKEHDITFVAKPFQVGEILEVVENYRDASHQRHQARLAAADADFAPRFDGPIGESFDLPHLPTRVEERLLARIRDAMTNLASVHRYTERERAAALSGIVATRVLGIKLPKGRSGLPLDQEFDVIMRQHGRRTEFDREDGNEG